MLSERGFSFRKQSNGRDIDSLRFADNIYSAGVDVPGPRFRSSYRRVRRISRTQPARCQAHARLNHPQPKSRAPSRVWRLCYVFSIRASQVASFLPSAHHHRPGRRVRNLPRRFRPGSIHRVDTELHGTVGGIEHDIFSGEKSR